MGRSPYYHAFKISWFDNRWLYFAVAVAIVMFVIGWFSRFVGNRPKIRRRVGKLEIEVIAGIAAIGFVVLLYRDSFAGIVQLFCNCLVGYEDPFYAYLFALFAVLFCGVVAGVFFVLMASLGQMAKCKFLEGKLTDMSKKRIVEMEAERARREMAEKASEKTGEEKVEEVADRAQETPQVIEVKTLRFGIGCEYEPDKAVHLKNVKFIIG